DLIAALGMPVERDGAPATSVDSMEGTMRILERLVLAVWFLGLLVSAEVARANPFAYSFQQLAPGVWAAIREDPFELPQERNAGLCRTGRGRGAVGAGGGPA